MSQREEALREALEDMVVQFAYWSESAGGYWTGGLSALEHAFELLGWDDPHPAPDDRCDEPGCMKQTSMGYKTESGYRRTCGKHGIPELMEALRNGADLDIPDISRVWDDLDEVEEGGDKEDA